MNKYKISYELDGGICTNPTEYTEAEALTLKAPLREGYRFAGWTGEGLSAPTTDVTIPAGSEGDRAYTALWEAYEEGEATASIDTTFFGADDGIESPETPIEPEFRFGSRGEKIYKLKTVYTQINIDGEKDAAYDYGVHIKSGASTNPAYHKENVAGFDAYLTMCQDGYVYCFAEVTDPTINVPDELWTSSWWRCDSIHFFWNAENAGYDLGKGIVFNAKGARSYGLLGPNIEGQLDHKTVRTEKGYNVEFRFSNNGLPFKGNGGLDGKGVAFAVYMNDLVRYESLSDQTKESIMCETTLCTDGRYHAPSGKLCDAFDVSPESATGRVNFAEAERPERTGDLIADIISGARRSVALCSPDTSAYTTEKVKKFILAEECFGKTIPFCDDVADVSEKTDTELLFCMTNRAESLELTDAIPYNGYALQILEDKIVVIGWLEKALDKAMGLLMSAFEYVRNGGKTSDLCSLYTGVLEELPGKNIPHVEGLTMVTDAGQGAYHLLCKNSSERVFNEYRDTLKSLGFKTHIEHTMHGTLCATLYNDEAIVTLHFGGNGDPTLHVVVDNYDYSALSPTKVAEYKPICKTKIIQVAPNFMCYLIKLDNGEFIAVDSGNNGRESFIYDQLMKHSEDGHPVIAAWFFSHFHQDHIGGFVDFAANEEYMKNVTIKAVIHNFPEQQVIKTAGGSWRDMLNVELWQDRIARTGATQILARTGQKFRIANAEIDTIFTYQELHPFFFTVDRTNPTSSVISVRIEGQRLIITGDCCGEATKLMVEKYGKELKTDFVQLPHHGWGDGGTYLPFYELCAAPWVLYPGDKYAPSPAEKWACEHCERYFLREFTTMAIPLPYNREEPEMC